MHAITIYWFAEGYCVIVQVPVLDYFTMPQALVILKCLCTEKLFCINYLPFISPF